LYSWRHISHARVGVASKEMRTRAGAPRGHVNQILLATQATSRIIARTPRLKESVISKIGMGSKILEVGNGSLES